MRVLFDQGTPEPLRQFLIGHQVDTAFERGWQTLANGELLKLAEAQGYAAIVTTDRNLRYQQNLSGRQLAILVLAAPQAAYGSDRRSRRWAGCRGLRRARVRARMNERHARIAFHAAPRHAQSG